MWYAHFSTGTWSECFNTMEYQKHACIFRLITFSEKYVRVENCLIVVFLAVNYILLNTNKLPQPNNTIKFKKSTYKWPLN